MTTLEFESQSAVLGSAKASTAPLRRVSRAARARLAVVSTYDDLCGIAAYTRSLERQLGDIFDVTVFDLNQFLLRSTHRRVRKFGDKHIQAICREIRHYDTVNLQLEHGTLGRSCSDIFRRFSWILRSSPQLSVTFHSIMQPSISQNALGKCAVSISPKPSPCERIICAPIDSPRESPVGCVAPNDSSRFPSSCTRVVTTGT